MTSQCHLVTWNWRKAESTFFKAVASLTKWERERCGGISVDTKSILASFAGKSLTWIKFFKLTLEIFHQLCFLFFAMCAIPPISLICHVQQSCQNLWRISHKITFQSDFPGCSISYDTQSITVGWRGKGWKRDPFFAVVVPGGVFTF